MTSDERPLLIRLLSIEHVSGVGWLVYFYQQPVWAMNYYGKIILPHLIDAAQAGQVIKTSLSQMYN